MTLRSHGHKYFSVAKLISMTAAHAGKMAYSVPELHTDEGTITTTHMRMRTCMHTRARMQAHMYAMQARTHAMRQSLRMGLDVQGEPVKMQSSLNGCFRVFLPPVDWSHRSRFEFIEMSGMGRHRGEAKDKPRREESFQFRRS